MNEISKLADSLPSQLAEDSKVGIFEKNREAMDQLNKHMIESNQNAIKDFYEKNPQYKKLIGYVPNGHAYVRKAGSHVILETMMRFVAYPNGLAKSKKQILEDVKKEHPKFIDSINYNAWYRKLKPAQWKKMQKIIQGSHVKSVSIRGCTTLSEIRKKLITESIKRSPKFTATKTITIDNDNVVIGKKLYSISTRVSKGKEYPSIRVGAKRTLINVTALRELLENS